MASTKALGQLAVRSPQPHWEEIATYRSQRKSSLRPNLDHCQTAARRGDQSLELGRIPGIHRIAKHRRKDQPFRTDGRNKLTCPNNLGSIVIGPSVACRVRFRSPKALATERLARDRLSGEKLTGDA
jgi:hypothetical protein